MTHIRFSPATRLGVRDFDSPHIRFLRLGCISRIRDSPHMVSCIHLTRRTHRSRHYKKTRQKTYRINKIAVSSIPSMYMCHPRCSIIWTAN